MACFTLCSLTYIFLFMLLLIYTFPCNWLGIGHIHVLLSFTKTFGVKVWGLTGKIPRALLG